MSHIINWNAEAEALKGKIAPSTGLTEVDWNDALFMEIYFPKFNTQTRCELSTAATCAKRLLIWYLGGSKPTHYVDSILAVWHQVTTKDLISYVLPDSQVKGGSTVLQPPGGDNTGTTNYKSSLSKNDDALTSDYAASWQVVLNSMLEDAQQRKTAINIIGFLFMNLMRCATKDPKMTSDHIWNTAIIAAAKFWDLPEEIKKLVPPSLNMIEQFKLETEKTTPNCQKLLGSLVHAFGGTPMTADPIQGILRAGCLISLQNTGLGLIKWLLQASSALSLEPVDLMKYLAYDRFNDVSERILYFLRETVNIDKKQYSWRWARLFSDGAFLSMRASSNWAYTYILVGLTCGGLFTDPIWETPSLAHQASETTKALNAGTIRAILEVKKKNSLDKGQTEEAKAVQAIAHLSCDPTESSAGEI